MIIIILSLTCDLNISRPEITIGELTHITVSVSPDTIVTPNYPDSSMIEIRKAYKKKGKTKSIYHFIVTAYKPGEKSIKFFIANDTLKPYIVKFTVKGVLTGKEKDILDITGPINMFNPLLLLYLLIPAFGYAGYALYRRRKTKKMPVVKEVPQIPPEEEALKALGEIENLINEDIKLFFTKISEVFRRYIERKYNILAVEATTSEISRQIKKRRIKSIEPFIPLLKEWDIYKFTEVVPKRERAMKSLKEVKEYINGTA
ncbi:hypothetical protein J7L85_02310 [candidate division WOR-3 bacterium]|nr:hypothetical protein [candidate division WOR-3 bacterium]